MRFYAIRSFVVAFVFFPCATASAIRSSRKWIAIAIVAVEAFAGKGSRRAHCREYLECLLSAAERGLGLTMSRSAIAIGYGSLGAWWMSSILISAAGSFTVALKAGQPLDV